MKTRLSTFLAFLLLLSPSSPLLAQSIHGRILVAGDTLGIDGVTVSVTDSAGVTLAQVQTDDFGWFRVALELPGTYRIHALRLGFTSTNAMILIGEREMVEVEMRMAEEPISLAPLLVVARRRIREGTLDEFYDRMARMEQKGRGYFITSDEIEGSGGASIPLLLHRVPGVFILPTGMSGHEITMRRPGQYCSPTLYIDGRPADYSLMPVMEDLEGVEVYRGRFEVVDGYWPDECGIIFLWRKNDWGNPFTWKRTFVFGGFGALFLAIALLA